MNIHSSLIAEMRDKAYRDGYVASQIKIGLPFQARALRVSRGLTQDELAKLAKMSQPRIAEIEKPGKRKFNLETLLRIAAAHDVGLEVRFVPISQIIDHSETFDPEAFTVPSFEEEIAQAERQEKADKIEGQRHESLNRNLRVMSASQYKNPRRSTELSSLTRPHETHRHQLDMFRTLTLVVGSDQRRGTIASPPPILAGQQSDFLRVNHG